MTAHRNTADRETPLLSASASILLTSDSAALNVRTCSLISRRRFMVVSLHPFTTFVNT